MTMAIGVGLAITIVVVRSILHVYFTPEPKKIRSRHER